VPPPALIGPLYNILLTGNKAVESFVRTFVHPESVRPVMRVVGLVDGYFGLILVFAAMQLPLALWIMKTYFDTIPRSMMKRRSSTKLNSVTGLVA
jgi:multiple sugar transport system permease protein